MPEESTAPATPAERAEYLALLKAKLPPDVYETIRRFVTDPDPPPPRHDPPGMRVFM
jgi:hypothetical protein